MTLIVDINHKSSIHSHSDRKCKCHQPSIMLQEYHVLNLMLNSNEDEFNQMKQDLIRILVYPV
jgi:hypothetical protein